MAQKQGDYFRSDPGFQKPHCHRVTKSVRRDAAVLERSHFDGCPLNELLELVGGASTSQALSKAVRQ